MDNALDKALLREGFVHARPSSEDCSPLLAFEARLIEVKKETTGRERTRSWRKIRQLPRAWGASCDVVEVYLSNYPTTERLYATS